MPEGPEFRLGIHKNFAIKVAPCKKRKITYKTVVVKKRWDSFVDLWYFLGYPFIRVTQHVVTWIYGVWIDLSWYRVECLEVGDFPSQLKCQDVFFLFSFFMWFTFVCWAQSEWHTLNISWTPWTPLFISWQNYVLIAISVGAVGTSDPVVKAWAMLRNWGDFKDDRVYCKERTVWWCKVAILPISDTWMLITYQLIAGFSWNSGIVMLSV